MFNKLYFKLLNIKKNIISNNKMDPHLRPVQDYNYDINNDKITEKEAYYLAKDNGYYFHDNIGIFPSTELQAIASHPPSINYNAYIRYRNMSFERLKELFPELPYIIGPSLTEEDLFYYATRGWMPQYDSLNYKIDRYNRYKNLSKVGQSLLDIIYGDQKGYVNKTKMHPLEKSIISYDQHMDNDSAVRSIGERIGIFIPMGVPAHDYFYDAIIDML